MKIRVDRELCQGAANCVVTAPKVFKLDNENKAVVIGSDMEDIVMEAAESCPFNAIIVEDDKGEQIYP
jgi:ferredoxin